MSRGRKKATGILVGAGASAALLWWLSRSSSSGTLPTPHLETLSPKKRVAARFAPAFLSTTDCSSYLPTSINPSDPTAPSQLAAFGACSGQNALVQGVIDSGVVQSIENAIEEGSIQAAQLVGIATIATQVVGAVSGLSVAAATSVMPVVGVVLTAVLAVGDWIGGLGGGPQIYVPNPNASGGDSISFNGIGTFEKINLSDYGGFVKNAMNWVNDNPQAALSLTPQQLSDQFAIFLTKDTPAQLAPLLASYANPLGQDVYTQLATNNPPPPGAYEILRAVQLPAAAAIAAAMPTKAGYLTNYGGSGGMGMAPLQSQFPALTTADMAAVFNAPLVNQHYWTAINNAQDYVNAQCPPITDPTILTAAPYSLAMQDAVQLLTQWAPVHPCPGYSAPIAQPGPQQCIDIPVFGQVCMPGPPTIAGGSTKHSTSSSIASGAVVVGSVAALGLLAVKLYKGYTVAQTFRSAWKDTKALGRKIGGAVKRGEQRVAKVLHHHRRRENPLPIPPATAGRTVAYRVVLGDRDAIYFESGGAVFYRNDQRIAAFRPSTYQKTKIRAGIGEVLIFNDQLI